MRYGELTSTNIEQFAEKMRGMLEGKPYIFVSANEALGYRPEIRQNQKLESLRVCRYSDTHSGVMFTYGVGSISAGEGARFTFDHEHDPQELRVEHKAPAGNAMWWVWKVQRGEA